MKTAIVYASVHHGNTEKVVKAIAEKHPEVELIDAAYKDHSKRPCFLIIYKNC